MTRKFTLALVMITAFLLSSCKTPYQGQQPAVTASPQRFQATVPSAGMGIVESYATGTALALTAAAGGAPNAITPTPVSGTPITPGALTQETAAPPQITFTPQVGAPTTATLPTIAAAATSTPVPVGVPNSYTLRKGEFPYCIARRFNLDPEYLQSYPGNEWTNNSPFFAGQVLIIPPASDSRRSPFPGERALIPHPPGTTYAVTGNNDTSFYEVACKFGDPDPNILAQLNNMLVTAILNIGQVIKIQ